MNYVQSNDENCSLTKKFCSKEENTDAISDIMGDTCNMVGGGGD